VRGLRSVLIVLALLLSACATNSRTQSTTTFAPLQVPATATTEPTASGRSVAPETSGDSESLRQGTACGVERWPVKTGSDADIGHVTLGHPIQTTVGHLDSLAQPTDLPPDNRIAPVETSEWTVDATLIEYKIEADSDVHLVIHDSAGRSMIAEIPHPSCVSASSPLRPSIAAVRTLFDQRFAPETSWRHAGVGVVITGLGFWDKLHGQTGVAPNGIEIHPVLAMSSAP